MVAGDMGWGQLPTTDQAFDAPHISRTLPAQLRRCRRVVAVTVHLPEFLVAASGLVPRLAAAGVRTDVPGGAEWARKGAALGACATQVTPLTGHHEYFGL